MAVKVIRHKNYFVIRDNNWLEEGKFTEEMKVTPGIDEEGEESEIGG